MQETIEIIPQTKPHYSFKPIPVSHAALYARKNHVWPIGRSTLIDYVRLPEERKRSRPLSEPERAYFQLELRELKLMIPKKKAEAQQ